MRSIFGLGVVASSLLLAAAGKPPSYFDRQPTTAQFRQALPAQTMKDSLGGRAVMRCGWTPTGALTDCAVASETPVGAGYGAALLSVAGDYHLSPEALKQLPAGGRLAVVGGWDSSDTGPDWVRRPSPEDLIGVWPRQAAQRGQGGRAVISCAVSVQGALFDCVPEYEDPVGVGFGPAAVALARQLLMRPATRKGEPVVSFVNLPINWQGFGVGFETVPVLDVAMAWREAPTYADVAAAYPKKARAAKLAGHATITCRFDADGRLHDCSTISEQPQFQGFGDAARQLAKRFLAPVTTIGGKPISRFNVELPVTFDPKALAEEKPAIGVAKWAELPNDEQTRAAFADVAKSTSGDVRVLLTCTVEQGGAVTGCEVRREDPPGHDVGKAAMTLAPHFKVTTWTAEGLPTVGGQINIPLRYSAGAPEPPPAAGPAKP